MGDTPTLAADTKAQALRFTSEDLKIDTTTTISEEIRDDRQYSDIIPTKIEATGSIKTEMSYGTYDDFLRAAISNSWVAANSYSGTTTGTTIAVVTGTGVDAPNQLVITETAHTPLKVGEAIMLSGFSGTTAEKNNGKVVVITDDTGTTATVGKYETVPALFVAASTTAGDALIENSGSIQNGLDDTSFSIEKQFNDVDKHLIYRGMSVNTASFTVEAESIVTTDWTFIGKSGETLSSQILEGSGDTAHTIATTNPIVSAGTQDCLLIIDGEEAGFVKSVSSEINNNLRGKTVVCVVGNAEIGQGRFMFTGNLSMYFKDFSIYQKYLDNETASLVFTIGNTRDGFYLFNLPRIKFTESNIVAGGVDQDVMVDGAFHALIDPDSSKTLTVTRFNGS